MDFEPMRLMNFHPPVIREVRALALMLLIPRGAFAHVTSGASESHLERTWTWDPWILTFLIVTAAVYLVGLVRSQRTTERGQRFATWPVGAFVLGWLVLVMALVSPVHAMGDSLFSAHMVQHELLMVIAAPLLVIGRPELICLWALPLSWRKSLARLQHLSPIHASGRFLLLPVTAWVLHGAALWIWHIPFLFNATLSHEWVHALQHASFLGTALLFWASLLYGHAGRRAFGEGIIYVFTTAVHTSILGALLTFASSPWYSAYTTTTTAWGLTPLEDQQLGGLIMWVPAGVVYIIVGLWLFAAWIRDSDRRSSFATAALATPSERF
jgi:putative membrane protein